MYRWERSIPPLSASTVQLGRVVRSGIRDLKMVLESDFGLDLTG